MKKPIYFLLVLSFIQVINTNIIAQNCVMNCKDTVIINLTKDCEAIVTSDEIFINPADCPGQGEIHIFNHLGIDIGNKVNKIFMDSILEVVVIGAPGNNYTCKSLIWVQDLTPPDMQITDVTINCQEANTKQINFKPPVVTDNCSGNKTYITNEHFFSFNCNEKGFQNYFKTVNWKEEYSCPGDGKMDFSGSPLQIKLIGAWNNPDTINLCKTAFTTIIPANGEINFNWKLGGLGNQVTEVFGVYINGNLIKLSGLNNLIGSYKNADLKKGDIFSLVQFSNGDSNNMTVIISEFNFLTDALGLLKVTWKSTDDKNNATIKDQHIVINAIDPLASVYFSSVGDVTMPCGSSTNPDNTGWPYINKNVDPLSIGAKYLKNGCVNIAYSDSIVKICEGSSNIYRRWALTSKCNGSALIHTQVIKLVDDISPVITKPKDYAFNTDQTKCSATVSLPVLKVMDACSPTNIKVDITTSFGANGSGPYIDVPLGSHTIYYTATDNCGNSSKLTSKLTIADIVPPKLFSKINVSVNLDKNGKAKILAKDLNNGSSDNCCFLAYKIKRVNDPVSYFTDSLILNCNDMSNGKATLCTRAYDCNGNFTDGNAVVLVKDNVPPTLLCPADKTISCTSDITNLDAYGKMTYTDNCTDQVLYTINNDIKACGTGTIKRNWKVTDASGNSGVCIQTLTLKYDQKWNTSNNKIAWPLDYSITGCKTIDDLKPAALPPPNKQPVITDITTCASLFIDFTDNVLNNSLQGCITVERNWVITDQCQYDATQGTSGKWTHKQLLYVIDNQAPVINTMADITVQAPANSCSAYVNMPPVTATDCDPDLIYTNSVNGIGSDISGNYNLGANPVNITVTDHCGNSTSIAVKITVKDQSNPVALCKQSVTIDLAGANQFGEKTVDPLLIDNSSSDNCTNQNQLILSVVPGKISCNDIGNKAVLLQVKDQSGNSATCNTIIIVTDNTKLCAPDNYKIAGHIKNPSGNAVEKVTAEIFGASNGQDITGVDGAFLFTQLTANKDYIIKPVKTLQPLNGVSTYDLILLNDHILGKKFLDSPYKYVAADVNNNKKISTSDYVAIRDLILLNTDKFAKVDSWRFIPSSYTFPSYQPAIPDFPEELQYNNLQQDIIDADFIAVKMGDLNNNSNPTKFNDVELRSSELMELIVEDQKIQSGEYFNFPVKVNTLAQLQAFQFALDFKAGLIKDAKVTIADESIINKDDLGDHINSLNILIISYLAQDEIHCCKEEILFSIEGFANNEFNLSELISLDKNSFRPEIYNLNKEVGEIHLKWIQKDIVNNPEISSIYPNPFNNRLEINLNISNTIAEITLSDIEGKELITKSINVIDNKSLVLDGLEDLKEGIYILKVKTGNGYTIRKVVKQTP